ncbi:hypothetical protein HRbin41_00497 [bacterium HR41]|nr:hypothetical protein HRbin41_00497 [bacterium HR41]
MARLFMWPLKLLAGRVLRLFAKRFATAARLRIGRGRLPDRRDPDVPVGRLVAGEAAAAAILAAAAALADRFARRAAHALTGSWPGRRR